MSITYEHTYNVTNIYNAFKKNRVNAVSYLGTSNNGKLEPDSSAYLSYENLYVNNYTYTYIYARKSSPTIDGDTDKNYAYLKVGDTTYNFYHGHAYTYTETVTGNGVKPILIAYDFVNQISTQLEFKDVSISHNASPISDIPQTVNVFSSVSYIIENGEKSLDPKNEYSISRDEINTLLNGKTFADFTTYVTYSYLNSEKRDGIVYEDGKDTLSTNPINDIHIWSLSDGIDMRPHAYVDNDTTAVNAYTYLNCGNILNTFFRNNVSNIFDYNSINYKYIKFYYDISVSNTNGVLQQWKAGIVGTDKIYAKDVRTGDNILDYSTFYQVCKVDLPDVSSFNEIYNKPSLRDNSDEINCYININGNSFPGDQEIAYIDKSNNINKSRFVKKINNLPIGILNNNITVEFRINNKLLLGYTDSDPMGEYTIDDICSYCYIKTLNNNKEEIETLTFKSDTTSIHRKQVTSGWVWDLERFKQESGNDAIMFNNSNSNFSVTYKDNEFNGENDHEYIESIFWTFELERTNKTKIDEINNIKIYYKPVNNFTDNSGSDGTRLSDIEVEVKYPSDNKPEKWPESEYKNDGITSLMYENNNRNNISIIKIIFVFNLPGDTEIHG